MMYKTITSPVSGLGAWSDTDDRRTSLLVDLHTQASLLVTGGEILQPVVSKTDGFSRFSRMRHRRDSTVGLDEVEPEAC